LPCEESKEEAGRWCNNFALLRGRIEEEEIGKAPNNK